MARSTTWTPELWEQILGALRVGSTLVAAYSYVGVPEATFFQWLKHRPELKDDVEEAKGRAMFRVSTRLMQMIDLNDGQSIRFFLERRDPDNWGVRSTVNQTVIVEEADPAQSVRAKLERMAQAATPPPTDESDGDGDTPAS